METIGFSSEDLISIFELLSAILNLGNIEFDGYSLPDGTAACNLTNQEGECQLVMCNRYIYAKYYFIAARFACDMLGCSFELLEQCITKRIVETSRDVVITPLSALEVRLTE